MTTAAAATVEMTFDDGTNMVVGPNSSLEVTEILMISGNRAGRFAVNALAGSFRFISGNSDKEAYEISTPTATMGVRGTEFDLAVTRSATALALFDGEVRICRDSRNCALVRGSCAVATTRGLRGIRGVSGQDAAQLLKNAFPLIPGQDRLASPFRVRTRSCDRYVEVPKERGPEPPAPEMPQPPTPQPPAPEPPAPKPAPDEPGFPGNSGDIGPSQGKGGGQSRGQDGTGTGNGQGAVNGKRGGNGNGNGNGRRSD
ncbi:FecR family protein [Yoonia sp.]|uniref:FecR family protein n=1 Tax=Yoonia sp. TaxID=2212373 RepID=UPI003F6D8D72